MAWKIKDIVVNGLLVTVLVALINYVLTWVSTQFSWLTKVLTFGGMGVTVGIVLAIGIAIEINKQIREKSGIGFLK